MATTREAMTPAEWRPPYESSRQERVAAFVVKLLAEYKLQLHVKKTCAICMLGLSCHDGTRLARRYLLAKSQHAWWVSEPQRLSQRCSHCGGEGTAVVDCAECPFTFVECNRCLFAGVARAVITGDAHRAHCRTDTPVLRRIRDTIQAEYRRFLAEGRA